MDWRYRMHYLPVSLKLYAVDNQKWNRFLETMILHGTQYETFCRPLTLAPLPCIFSTILTRSGFLIDFVYLMSCLSNSVLSSSTTSLLKIRTHYFKYKIRHHNAGEIRFRILAPCYLPIRFPPGLSCIRTDHHIIVWYKCIISLLILVPIDLKVVTIQTKSTKIQIIVWLHEDKEVLGI